MNKKVSKNRAETVKIDVMESITIDCVIFDFREGSLEVLLVKHAEGISKGKWGFRGDGSRGMKVSMPQPTACCAN